MPNVKLKGVLDVIEIQGHHKNKEEKWEKTGLYVNAKM